MINSRTSLSNAAKWLHQNHCSIVHEEDQAKHSFNCVPAVDKAMLQPAFSFQIIEDRILNIPPGPDHFEQGLYIYFQTRCYNHDLGMLAILMLHGIFDQAKRLIDILHDEG